MKVGTHVVFNLVKEEGGEWKCSSPHDSSGFLLEISIIDAIIKACKDNKRKYKSDEIREAMNAKWYLEDEAEGNRQREIDRSQRAKIKQNPAFKPCHIYLIKDRIRGYFKIGQSKNYQTRFDALKTANPSIELTLVCSGIKGDEPFLHKYFSDKGKHIGGEWFSLDEYDIKEILIMFEQQNRPIIYNNLAA